MTDMPKTNLEFALEYAARGWRVLPLHGLTDQGCTCGKGTGCSAPGKHPAVARGAHSATTDPDTIRAWWEACHDYNIGIATGEGSNLTIADIDVGDNKCGGEVWSELLRRAEISSLETPMVETGSGGLHVYFAYNSALKNGTDVFGLSVDCRNNGGYVVAPPSRHVSGGTYSWLVPPETPPQHLPSEIARIAAAGGLSDSTPPAQVRRRYSLATVEAMLSCVSADGRDMWRNVGIILGREFGASDEAWDVYVRWADQYTGARAPNHNDIMHEAFYVLSQRETSRPLTIATIARAAMRAGYRPSAELADPAAATGGMFDCEPTQFVYIAPDGRYLFEPTREFWPQEAVNVSVAPVDDGGELIKPTAWIRRNRRVQVRIFDPDFAPGTVTLPPHVAVQYGAVAQALTAYNMYRPGIPTDRGDPDAAEPFVEHVRRLLTEPGDADQMLNFMAHRVQRPGEKIRFALVLAGEQGVGKDTIIEMCKPAIGMHNCRNITPMALTADFNEFVCSLLLTIDEASDVKNLGKLMFAERVKTIIAGAPDYVTINPKYERKYDARNVTGVIITTNHLGSGGLYVAEDDRRYDILRAATAADMGMPTVEAKRDYFDELWGWYNTGGKWHIAAYLARRDISGFDPSRNRPATDAAQEVRAMSTEIDSWALDALAALGNPRIVTAAQVMTAAESLCAYNKAELYRRVRPALLRCGYKWARNPDTKSGTWNIGTVRHSVYCKSYAHRTTIDEFLKKLKCGDSDGAF